MKNRKSFWLTISLVGLVLVSQVSFASEVTEPTHDQQIVGGTKVTATDPISKVVVGVLARGAICTGSIVAKDLVITAAHCLTAAFWEPEIQPSEVELVFGNDLRLAMGSSTATVTGYAIPTTWNGGNVSGKDQGDIALVRFSGGLPAGYKTAAVLSNNAAIKNGGKIVLAGYGVTEMVTESGAGILRKVETTIVDAAFGKTEVLVQGNKGKGACHGDSGGPAYLKASNGSLTLWGVTNRGYPDSAPDNCLNQAVYTNINTYRNWVNQAAVKLRKPATP